MRKIWTVLIDGVPRVVDVTWDVSATGSGRIVVDGVELDRWHVGMKYPGKTMRFAVGGREAVVRQSVLDFELLVDGVEVPGAQRAPWSRSGAALAITAGLVMVVLVGAGLIALVAFLALR